MPNPPVVITNPIEDVIAGDDTSTPDTAITYFAASDYNSASTAGSYSMPYDNAALDSAPSVDTENLVAGDDTSAPDTAISYFVALENVYTATVHRSHSGGDYWHNPSCDQKRVGAIGG